MLMYTKEWLISRTRFYQNLNFFEEYRNLSDDVLADRMIWLGQERRGVGISNLIFSGWVRFLYFVS